MGLGILCPGQGGQNATMLDLFRDEPAARAVLDRAAAIMGDDPRALVRGDPAMMTRNRVAQPLICAAQAAAWAALAERVPRPLAVAGYSIGELAAYHITGCFELETVLGLAIKRAEMMDHAMGSTGEPGAMLAVRGLDRATLLAFGAEIAIANGPDRFVIGGTASRMAGLRARLEAAGASVTDIAVDVASHTSLMTAAVAPFAACLHHAAFTPPRFPVLAGINGAPVWNAGSACTTLSTQLAQTVEWADCLDGLAERGCTILLELGPGDGLSRMAQARHPAIAARSLAEFHSLDGVLSWVERQLV
jgi:[acyl-carrier-protein] S-malonyltransferase